MIKEDAVIAEAKKIMDGLSIDDFVDSMYSLEGIIGGRRCVWQTAASNSTKAERLFYLCKEEAERRTKLEEDRK